MEVTLRLRYKNHVRITSGSYVRLALGNYVIKPCKWEEKIRNNYIMAYVIITSLERKFASWDLYKNVCTCIQKYMYLNLGQSEPDRERQRKGLKRKNFIRTFSFISRPCMTRMTAIF